MADSNPIAQAFDTLVDQWVSFAQDERARLLLWQATIDAETRKSSTLPYLAD